MYQRIVKRGTETEGVPVLRRSTISIYIY